MPEALTRPRTLFGISAVLALAILATYIAMVAVPGRLAIAQGGQPEPLSALECEALLIHAGLDAERLAIAGITSLEAVAVAAAGIAAVQQDLDELRGGFTDVGVYRNQVEALTKAITSGKDHEGDAQALATAKTNLAAARAARDALLDGVFNSAVAGLTDNQEATLASLRTQPVVNLPNPYRLAGYGQADQVVLRDALAQQRISADAGEDLDQDNLSIISTAEALNGVNNAIANLNTLGQGCKNAWDAAMDSVDE